MVRRLLQFLSLIVFFTSASKAQTPEFRHLSINDGLSQNAVFSITQDHMGFMWFGTKDGLNRYDGQSFTVYQHDPFDSTSITGNYIKSLYTDSRGWIWIGTLENGLNYYTPERDLFSNLHHLSNSSDQIINDHILSLSEDLNGDIWLGTSRSGVYRIKRNSSTGIPVSITNYSVQDGLANNQIYKIFVDEKGKVWIGSDKHVSKYQETTDSFFNYEIKFNKENESSYQYYYAIDDIHPFSENRLWLSTSEGLALFNTSTGASEIFSYNDYSELNGYNRIRDIASDTHGRLWLATPTELTIFNPATNIYNSYKSDPFNSSTISYNSITSVYKSKNGLMWIGTAGMGINIYDPLSNRFATLSGNDLLPELNSFSLREVLEDKNGDVWLIANQPYLWKRDEQTLINVNDRFLSDHLNDSHSIEIWDLTESEDGTIWAATTQGLIAYHAEDNQTSLFEYSDSQKEGLPQREIYGVFEDSKGAIWVVSENYLSELVDPLKNVFKNYRYNPSRSIREQIRPVIIEDKTGNLWIGTTSGLIYFDRLSESFIRYQHHSDDLTSLSNNLVKSILPDPENPDQYLWIGTSGGLNRMDISTKHFTHYTTADGLPNNVVYSILPDTNNHLWLSTNRGLSRFDPKKMDFRNYDRHDGLQSNEFNTGAYFKSDSGEMFFGGIEGLNYFYPERIYDNPIPPVITLTEFSINDQKITFENSPEILDSPLPFAKKINVKHNDEVLSFQFAALDYSAPEKNQYAYKLEGLSEQWVELGNYASAIFTNLPHGEYTLHVKGSNNDGVWNEAGIRLNLIVSPPWWLTWWAYTIYLLLFITAGYSIRRYELNRYNLENDLKLERVKTESLRKLDHLKSQFFANISHEFRTPLTLILGQIESVMASNIGRNDKYKLEMADANANRLLTLINQLLTLSKLESGKLKMQIETHNMVSFLKNILYSFETLAESNSISLSFSSDSKSIPMQFDSEKMEQVFLNLITNAFKFTDDGGKIAIKVRMKCEETVEIKVIDSGVGIPENHIKNIFDRFYQVENRANQNLDGTGIGLALVNEFINLHNGRIDVTSQQSKEDKSGESGTTFTIHLPIGTVDTDTLLSDKQPKLTLHDHHKKVPHSISQKVDDILLSKTLQKEIILIVEDNHEIREFIREQLKQDYRVVESKNGTEGIEQSISEIPDLIISDLMMPGMDGYDFCKKIRSDERTSHIPVIMLTAKAGLENRLKGLETGIDAYLTKPFRVEELRVRVRKLIQQRKHLQKQFSDSGLIRTANVTDDSIEKAFLEKAIKIVENNFNNEKFNVQQLANEVKMSPSQLNRKLHALLDQTAVQFMIAVRLQHAAKLLKCKNKTIAEISYEIGYNDQAYFTRVFKKQFGMSPTEFRNH